MKLHHLALILLTLAVITLTPLTVYSAEVDQVQYYLKVEYTLQVESSITYLIKPGKSIQVAPLPSPPGFNLKCIELEFTEPLPPSVKVEGKDVKFVKVPPNLVKKVIVYGERAVLINKGNEVIRVRANRVFKYTQTTYIPIRELRIKVETPEVPKTFGTSSLVMKIELDNYAPYRIKDVITPHGTSLLRPDIQEQYPPDTTSIDYKHVVIKLGRELPTGTYTIVLEKGKEYVLPSAMLVAGESFYNLTIPPMTTEQISTPLPEKGWKHLGYVVLISTVYPVTEVEKGDVKITADLVDKVMIEKRTISVAGISYLIPPIKFKTWIKAYIVYGTTLQIENTFSYPVIVIYIPLKYREVGKWTEKGLEIKVSENDIATSVYAYLVVQVPEHAEIKSVVTPSGAIYENYVDSEVPWAGINRTVSITEKQAYIAVKIGEVYEVGTYRFFIKWKPMTVKVIDTAGNPLPNATITIEGPITTTLTTDATGKVTTVLYRPGPYTISIKYMGVEVGKYALGTVLKTDISVMAQVYNLKLKVVGVREQPIENAIIKVMTETGKVITVARTDTNGTAVIKQLPRGKYRIEVKYVKTSAIKTVELDNNKEEEIKLDIFMELPVIGPVTTLEALLLTGGIGGGTIALALIGKLGRRKEEDVEEEEPEIETEFIEE